MPGKSISYWMMKEGILSHALPAEGIIDRIIIATSMIIGIHGMKTIRQESGNLLIVTLPKKITNVEILIIQLSILINLINKETLVIIVHRQAGAAFFSRKAIRRQQFRPTINRAVD